MASALDPVAQLERDQLERARLTASALREQEQEEVRRPEYVDAEEVPSLTEVFRSSLQGTTKGLAASTAYFEALAASALEDENKVAAKIEEAQGYEAGASAAMANIQQFPEFLENPTVEGFLTQSTKATAQILPFLAQSMVTAGIGAGTGLGLAGLRASSQSAFKKVAKDAIENTAKGTATPDEKDIAKGFYQLLKEKSGTYMKRGALTGAAAAEYVPITGENFSEALESGLDPNDPDTVFRSAVLGVPMTALGVGSEYFIAKSIYQRATKLSENAPDTILGRLAADIRGSVKKGAIEGPVEAAQESIAVLNRASMDSDYDISTDGLLRIGEAAFVGGIGSGITAGVAGGAAGAARELTGGNVVKKARKYVEDGKQQRTENIINSELNLGENGITDPESLADLEAQVEAMLASDSAKTVVFSNTDGTDEARLLGVDPTKPEVQKFTGVDSTTGEEKVYYGAFVKGRGVILGTNEKVVTQLKKGNANPEALSAALFNKESDFGIPANADSVIQVLQDGKVISEEAIDSTDEFARLDAQDRARKIAGKNKNRTVSGPVSIDTALAERAARVAQSETGDPVVRSAQDEDARRATTPDDAALLSALNDKNSEIGQAFDRIVNLDSETLVNLPVAERQEALQRQQRALDFKRTLEEQAGKGRDDDTMVRSRETSSIQDRLEAESQVAMAATFEGDEAEATTSETEDLTFQTGFQESDLPVVEVTSPYQPRKETVPFETDQKQRDTYDALENKTMPANWDTEAWGTMSGAAINKLIELHNQYMPPAPKEGEVDTRSDSQKGNEILINFEENNTVSFEVRAQPENIIIGQDQFRQETGQTVVSFLSSQVERASKSKFATGDPDNKPRPIPASDVVVTYPTTDTMGSKRGRSVPVNIVDLIQAGRRLRKAVTDDNFNDITAGVAFNEILINLLENGYKISIAGSNITFDPLPKQIDQRLIAERNRTIEENISQKVFDGTLSPSTAAVMRQKLKTQNPAPKTIIDYLTEAAFGYKGTIAQQKGLQKILNAKVGASQRRVGKIIGRQKVSDKAENKTYFKSLTMADLLRDLAKDTNKPAGQQSFFSKVEGTVESLYVRDEDGLIIGITKPLVRLIERTAERVGQLTTTQGMDRNRDLLRGPEAEQVAQRKVKVYDRTPEGNILNREETNKLAGSILFQQISAAERDSQRPLVRTTGYGLFQSTIARQDLTAKQRRANEAAVYKSEQGFRVDGIEITNADIQETINRDARGEFATKVEDVVTDPNALTEFDVNVEDKPEDRPHLSNAQRKKSTAPKSKITQGIFPLGALTEIPQRIFNQAIRQLKLTLPVNVITFSQIKGVYDSIKGDLPSNITDLRLDLIFRTELENRLGVTPSTAFTLIESYLALADAGADFGRYIGFNDSHYIFVNDTKLGFNDYGMSYVVMHELGHALYRETLAGIADKKIYKRLYADFEKTRANSDVNAYEGSHGFEEWFADQFAAWTKEQFTEQYQMFDEDGKPIREKAGGLPRGRIKNRVSDLQSLDSRLGYYKPKGFTASLHNVFVDILKRLDAAFKTLVKDFRPVVLDDAINVPTIPLAGRERAARTIQKRAEAQRTVSFEQFMLGEPGTDGYEGIILQLQNAAKEKTQTPTQIRHIVRSVRDAVEETANVRSAIDALRTNMASLYKDLSAGLRPLRKLLYTADANLREISTKLADLMYVPAQATGFGGRMGFLQEADVRNRKIETDFEEKIGQFDDPVVIAAMELASSETPTTSLTDADPQVAQKAKDIRNFLSDLYKDYVEPSQTNYPPELVINFQENYFPVSLNLDAIARNPSLFVDIILEYESPDVADVQAIEKAVRRLLSYNEAVSGIDPALDTLESLPDEPAEQIEKMRRLTANVPRDALNAAFASDPELQAEFPNGLLKDPISAFRNYKKQLVKRVEWNRATRYQSGEKAGQSFYDEVMEEIKITKGGKEADDARRIVQAYLGYGIKPMSPTARSVQSVLLATQYTLLLPLAVIGSLPELAGPIINSKEFNGFNAAWRQILNGGTLTRQDATNLAKRIGLVQEGAIANGWITVAEQEFLSPAARSWTDKFFRYTGLEMFTNFTRTFATGMAVEFLTTHANDSTNPRSSRYLRDLGVSAADVQAWNKSQDLSTPEGRRVERAIVKFVESSVLRPNAAERPLWASDPRYALVWQLKSYFYAFSKNIMGGVIRETTVRRREAREQGISGREQIPAVMGAMALAAVALLPLAMIGMELREYAKTGSAFALTFGESDKNYFTTDDMTWAEYIGTALDKAGIFGPLTILYMANKSTSWNGAPAGIATLLGPTFETADAVLRRGEIDRITPGFAIL